VLILSPTTPALTSYESATYNETGIATGAGATVGLRPSSQGTGYTLSDIGFQIKSYVMICHNHIIKQ
jgi:hypothetical protein